MIISGDLAKRQVKIQFHGSLRRTDLLGKNEVVLFSGPYLDEGYLDDNLYLDDHGGTVYIDQPPYPDPCVYYEDYLQAIDDVPEGEPYDDINPNAVAVQNKLVFTW